MNFSLYSREVKDGLTEVMRANSSVSYASLAEPYKVEEKIKSKILEKHEKSLGGLNDEFTYFVKSIMVSSNINLNDDVFLPEEIWKARNTAKFKLTNIDHKEDKIVGSIADCYCINDDGEIISDDTSVDELPSLLHLIDVGFVVSKWEDPELQQRVDNLIEEIEAGKRFVSQECYFPKINYLLKDKNTGESKIIERNKDTCFLSSKLRAYGGQGEYDNYKIYRVLRDFTFSGKGFVCKPGNPESKILSTSSQISFDKLENFSTFSEKCVINNSSESEEKQMSDTNQNLLESQVKKLEDSMQVLTKQNVELQDKLASANVEKFQEQITEMKSKNEAAKAEIDVLKTELGKAEDKVKELETAKTESDKKMEELTKSEKDLKDKISKSEKQQKMVERVSSLVSGGVKDIDAKSAVEKYAYLSDDQFKSISEVLIENVTLQKSDKGDPSADKVLDSADDKSQANLNSDTDTDPDDGQAKVRSSLADWAKQTFKLDEGDE